MNVKKRVAKWSVRSIGVGLTLFFLYFMIHYFSFSQLIEAIAKLVESPVWLGIMVTSYTLAFSLKAYAWKLYLKNKGSFIPFWSGIHYALFMNHILPFKTGDVIRAGVLKGATATSWEKSVSSVVAMRVLDLGSLLLLAAIGTYYYMNTLFYVLLFGGVSVLLFTLLASVLVKSSMQHPLMSQLYSFAKLLFSPTGSVLFIVVLMSWVLEGFTIYSVASVLVQQIDFAGAVWVTSMAVGSGIFQITPGHIAGYESVTSYTMTFVGLTADQGLTIAVVTHIFKFIYAYITGVVSFFLTPVSRDVIRSWFIRRGKQ